VQQNDVIVTLHMPFSPDQIVESNLVLPSHLNSFEILPLRSLQLTAEHSISHDTALDDASHCFS